jgi:hypothetical protein
MNEAIPITQWSSYSARIPPHPSKNGAFDHVERLALSLMEMHIMITASKRGWMAI